MPIFTAEADMHAKLDKPYGADGDGDAGYCDDARAEYSSGEDEEKLHQRFWRIHRYLQPFLMEASPTVVRLCLPSSRYG
jgi:hypothetical protein